MSNSPINIQNRIRAANVLGRRLRRNVFGTYTGHSLIPRIKVTPNENEKRTRVLDNGKRWGGRRIDLKLIEGLDGMFEELWLVRVTDHEEYSRRTFSAKANNLVELYRRLGRMRRVWIRQVEEQSEVYDIIRMPIGVEVGTTTETMNGRGNVLQAPMLDSGCMEIDG
ncbi:MAG TPA: hypothetical protein DEG69_07585, partial [Flavobacteriaceae bacterium]|nr:hypothetical protein [Flavobacteriaceae bacterium]